MKSFIFVIMMAVSSWAFAQEMIEKSYTGQSQEINDELARKQIVNLGAQTLSETIIQDLIGMDRFIKNKALIQRKVISQNSKYTPFIKNSELTLNGDQKVMTVTYKFSVNELRKMLTEQGLLQNDEGLPQILPIVALQNKINSNDYRWWKTDGADADPTNLKIMKKIEEVTRNSFRKNQLFIHKPIEHQFYQVMKNDSWSEKIAIDDLRSLGLYFYAPVVVEGMITLEKSNNKSIQLNIKLTGVQLNSNKIIGDVSRKILLPINENQIESSIKDPIESAMNDLSTQVFEVWQKGTIDALTYRLSLKGKIPFLVQDKLKEHLKSLYFGIKSITERQIDNQGIVYEVASTQDMNQFAQTIKTIEIDQIKFRYVKVQGNEVIYQQYE